DGERDLVLLRGRGRARGRARCGSLTSAAILGAAHAQGHRAALRPEWWRRARGGGAESGGDSRLRETRRNPCTRRELKDREMQGARAVPRLPMLGLKRP